MADKIIEGIKKLRESKKRNFLQSFDLIVNLKNINIKKPENKINEIVELPNGRGKPAKIAIFSDSLKDENLRIITSEEIERLGKNKRELKKLAKKIDFFLSEPKLMPVVGKNLGMILAPRGKMPTILTGDVSALVKRLTNSVRVRIKDSPVIQCIVGSEDMEDEKIAENVEAVIKFLEKRLPKGKNNIESVLLKLTMSRPIRVW